MAKTAKQVELLAKQAEDDGYLQLDKMDPSPQPNERGAWIKSNSPWVEKIENYNCWSFRQWDDQMPSLAAFKAYLAAGKKKT